MADCVALRQSSGYNDIALLEIKNFRFNLPPLFPITSLQQYNSTKQAISNERNRVQNLKSKLDAAIAKLEAGGCSARSVGAGAPYSAIERLERELDLNTQTVEREWERTQEAQAGAAQKAAATQNNAGTGTPGTAGTGPGASPAPAPSPTTVTGPTGSTSSSAAPTTGSTGPQPVVSDPAIPTDAGPIDIGTDPNINLGEDPPQPEGSSQGLEGEKDATIQTASRQDAINYARAGDWRVRLALAPNAKYIYDLPDGESPGILAPLRATDGVIFPYTPNISIAYAASYDPTNITHSNYKIFQYQYSSVDNISISCDFTAQDTYEANYLLAVIHFFRTVTKMFYGQDQNPKAGTPPPLCYLYGLGQFQFNAHPLVITNFTYNLPTDVDYIRATSIVSAGQSVAGANIPNNTTPNPSNDRLSSSQNKVQPGGVSAQPNFSATPPSNIEPTYVPTKILIQINAVPIVSRNDISKRFSIKDYATGKLLNGKDNPTMGGIW